MKRLRPRITAHIRYRQALHLRLDFGGERSIGPGKARLLELIEETGSISAAGRALEMSWRQAWLLIDELNHMFRVPVVSVQIGGGGELTETGAKAMRLCRQMENRASDASSGEIRVLAGLLAASPAK